MTDARLPGRWLMNMKIAALSDRAWRVFTSALMWSNEQGTDGQIPPLALRFVYPADIPSSVIDELIVAELAERRQDGGFNVRDWGKTQSPAAVVEHQRERNRLKVRAHRERKKSGDVTGDVTTDVTGYDSGHTPRTGQARTGKDRQGYLEQAESSEIPSTSWPVASIPRDDACCNHGVTVGGRCSDCDGIARVAA